MTCGKLPKGLIYVTELPRGRREKGASFTPQVASTISNCEEWALAAFPSEFQIETGNVIWMIESPFRNSKQPD